MQLKAFRVKNFRSIVDSGWVQLSPDGITAFVGQNECGKSSLLAALAYALSYEDPTEDDLRISGELPSIEFAAKLNFSEIEKGLSDAAGLLQITTVQDYLSSKQGTVHLSVEWGIPERGERKLERLHRLLSPELSEKLSNSGMVTQAGRALLELSKNGTERMNTAVGKLVTGDQLAKIIWQELPLGVYFKEDEGQLPNRIDINQEGEPFGKGAYAAESFLRIAGVDLPELIGKDIRTREYLLNKANQRVSEDFNTFWSQTIGRDGKLSLLCEINNYDNSYEKLAGQPHLSFWICDGHTKLYPRQRSQGVRWFISFYLQLKASEKDGLDRVFLLDEPGSNLHPRAQADVLRLINNLAKTNSTVIYSTHSPQLLENQKLYRVYALQRNSDLDDSPTTVIDAHRLGTASSDTLSPILMAMGADLSHQQAIRQENNVLLEEMSGHYYLSAFWRLSKQKKRPNFIAATGVNKIEPLANMFCGWGLDFIVVTDDDKQARDATNSIKRNIFGENEELAARKILRIRGCHGIEDIFSTTDFCKFVLCDAGVEFKIRPSEYVKEAKLSKPVLAFQFFLAVEHGRIRLDEFDSNTSSAIIQLTDSIASRLE